MSRDTIRKGIKEVKSGNAMVDKFNERGRHKTEEDFPELGQSMQQIVDEVSQIDPKFTSSRLYTRLSPGEVLNQLEKQGYPKEELSCARTIANILKRLGYHRKQVAQTTPKKN